MTPNEKRKKELLDQVSEACDTQEGESSWDPTVVLVMPEPCKNCLMGANRLVSEKVATIMLERIAEAGNTFQCHLSTIAGDPRCCNLFFKANSSLTVRLAKMNGWWERKWIEGPDGEDVWE